jgi:hypothetical protein
MSILTETKYLDEITFSGGSQADYPGTSTTDWTDGDTGSGVSDCTGLLFDGKSCFKFDSGAAGAGNVAIRSRDVGSFATPEWITLKTYFDTIGTLADADYFAAVFNGASYRLSIRFCSDGLYVYDGSAWNEVGTNLVVQDTWQEWTFNWTVAAAGVVDVYLDGALQSSAVDCSDATAGTNGTATFSQYGTTVQGVAYLDYIKIGTAQRYGGETLILQEGAELTIRTDTRWHKYSPASMLGSLGSQTVTQGKLIYDGTDVRWLAYDTGTGTVPAVGTSITKSGVTGILLGVWDSLTSAPTAVGAAMPADGFIKFLSVSNGPFSAGALTGIGASALGADVTGWIEIVADSSSTITVGRLGEHEIRGDWFYLDNTTGSAGQQLQGPTNGGGSGTHCPGVWIESSPGSGEYEYWPSLYGSTNGWDRRHIGGPLGGMDARQNFVKDVDGGILQIGETVDWSCTYENIAAQASAYTALAHTCTYAVVNNVCTVTYPTGHLLQTGHVVGVEFTSGGASALDANFTVTVLDAYQYSFALTTGDTSGNCTARPGLSIAFTAHTLGVGDSVYCDFTSGTGVDGDCEIYAVISANAYLIKYPATSAVTGGNVSIYSRYTIRYTGAVAADFMNLTAGNRVYLNFTSGSGVDGTYPIVYPTAIPVVQAATYSQAGTTVTVTFTAHGRKVGDSVYIDATSGTAVDGVYTIATAAANTFTYTAGTSLTTSGNCNVYHASFDIVANNNGADSGNVTVQMCIGNVPVSGCKTRIPNVFLREAATASRASNRVDAAIATRPEWATSGAGAVDIEYAYSTWYHNFAQAYSAKNRYSAYYDSLIVSECATALDFEDVGASMFGALDAITFSLTSNFAGGTIQDCKFQRGNTPASSDHAISVNYCLGLTFDNVVGGIIQYARSSGYPFSFSYGGGHTMNNCKAMNGTVSLSVVNGMTINDLDYTNCYMGYGKLVSALYGVTIGAGSVDVLLDGITFGFGGNIDNVHPPAGLASITAAKNVTVRNIGTFDNPLPCGSFRPNAYAMAVAYASGGNNYNVRVQRVYVDNYARTGLLTTVNSDKLCLYDSVFGARYIYSAMAIFLQIDNGLNSVIRGAKPGANSVSGATSVYGTHFVDYFIGDTMGRYVLPMNEPTAETETYFTMVTGTEKFNSVGGILMGTVNDQAIWEDAYYRKGHTGFQNTTPTMSGGTIGNYTIEYDIDVNDGNGFTDSWTAASGANLSAETIDPAKGFKLKVRITTTTANLTAITFLRFDTTTTLEAQENNLYELDEYRLTITGLVSGSDVVVLEAGTNNVLDDVDAVSGTTWDYIYFAADTVDIGIFKAGYTPLYIRNLSIQAANASMPVAQMPDRYYLT